MQIQTRGANKTLQIYNSGTADVFVEFGDADTVAASASDSMPVPAGACLLRYCPHTYVAVITGTGTATVFLTPGNGGF